MTRAPTRTREANRPARTPSAKSGAGGLERSCYVLEWSVDPGGARHSHVFVSTSLAHIRACLDQAVISSELEPHVLVLMIGGTMVLRAVQRGVVTAGIDQRVTFDYGFADLELGDEGGPMGAFEDPDPPPKQRR